MASSSSVLDRRRRRACRPGWSRRTRSSLMLSVEMPPLLGRARRAFPIRARSRVTLSAVASRPCLQRHLGDHRGHCIGHWLAGRQGVRRSAGTRRARPTDAVGAQHDACRRCCSCERGRHVEQRRDRASRGRCSSRLRFNGSRTRHTPRWRGRRSAMRMVERAHQQDRPSRTHVQARVAAMHPGGHAGLQHGCDQRWCAGVSSIALLLSA